MPELVGDFYVHLIDGVSVSKTLTSSTKLLTNKKVPTVMHFYDGGFLCILYLMCINIILLLLSLVVAQYKWAVGRQNMVIKFNF